MRPRQVTIALPVAGIAVLGAFAASDAYGEFAARGGHVETPESSIEQPEHHGHRAHTNYKMFVPNAGGMSGAQGSSLEAPSQTGGPPYPGYFYETPASLACVYQLVSLVPGCNPNAVNTPPSGGSRAIAIVDAYHYSTAMHDLQVFSAQFGLLQPNLQVVFANGRQPPVNANWNVEEALDIEWAHAMAPNAKIYLVEAASSSFSDLLKAVSVANSLVGAAGGGEVSMSWGGSEFSAETSYDPYFTRSGVVYFASSGDSPGVDWPSTSPNVVSVGGTSISRNPMTGNFQEELAWQSGGGGPSVYETRPSYQNTIMAIVGNQRGTPDAAADADPSTGVWVYAYPYWYIVGGTSVAAPVWAGIVNAAASFSSSSKAELMTIYTSQGETDITAGSCGPNQGYMAKGGWDFCTGLGSPLGKSGK
ncbi:MAG: S53 family peptidase [Acetobacteraceae bacterium]|nr:S53 family peptidase [Acetobacteraceae bacterium]